MIMELGVYILINVLVITVGQDQIVPNATDMDIIGTPILKNVVVIPDGVAVIAL